MTTPDRQAAARAIEAFLRAIGRDPSTDPNLAGTGARVADAYIDELCDGYGVDVAGMLEGNTIAGSSEIVVVRDIAVTTMCPHHLLPAEGTATVAFAPQGKLVGVGAIVKLVDAFAHRLTLQEQIGEEVARALASHVTPRWAACRLLLSHACMCARGERRQGARVESVSVHGATSEGDRAAAHRALGLGGAT
jgi:GTP cyclohydrolase I